jgi:hypothetical protein
VTAAHLRHGSSKLAKLPVAVGQTGEQGDAITRLQA